MGIATNLFFIRPRINHSQLQLPVPKKLFKLQHRINQKRPVGFGITNKDDSEEERSRQIHILFRQAKMGMVPFGFKLLR